MGAMGLTTIQKYAAGALALFLLLGLTWCAGTRHQATADKLSANHAQILVSDSSTKSVQIRTTESRKKDSVLFASHDVIRTKVVVRHDSVFVRDTVFISPDIAQLIQSDDSLIAAQKRSLALQDTLVVSLHHGITLRDERIALLEKQHSPRLGIKSGIAIGAVGTVALVVVAVKVIQAFHK